MLALALLVEPVIGAVVSKQPLLAPALDALDTLSSSRLALPMSDTPFREFPRKKSYLVVDFPA